MHKLLLVSALILFAVGSGDILAQESAPANLAANPGFEEPADAQEGLMPAGWEFFTSKISQMGITREIKRSGQQAMKLRAQKVPGAYQGVFQKIPVTPKEKYTFAVNVISDKSDPLGGTAHGQLVIEWYNAQGKEISREYCTPWNINLSKLRWEPIALRKKVAPAGATTASFGIHFSEGERGGEGAFIVDDIVIEK